MECTMRPWTVHRVPKERRWTDNLSFVMGQPWKHNKINEAGEEVILDTTPPAPSFHPATTVLPPTMYGEPVVRGMYVKEKDLGPDDGGTGYTGGCPGCKVLIKGTTATGHSGECRRMVKEKIS